MLRSPQNLGIIHFIGIGGIGMSGIAEILFQSGYHVQGSDISENKNIDRLKKLGIKIYLEQKNYAKAIQSYKILILKYPEKSALFADQIKAVEKLQEKIKKS